MTDNTQAQLPTPDPALKRLDRFVGAWSMQGHLPGSETYGPPSRASA